MGCDLIVNSLDVRSNHFLPPAEIKTSLSFQWPHPLAAGTRLLPGDGSAVDHLHAGHPPAAPDHDRGGVRA